MGMPWGRARQDQIYRAGVFGHTPTVPTDAAQLQRRAVSAMSRKAAAYLEGGAGQGASMAGNRSAFERWQIVPRMAHGTTERDLRTSVAGTDLPAPLLLAPIGAADLVRRGSDLLIAEGAAAAGLPYVVSSQGCSPMEQTAAVLGETPWWFQLYWSTDDRLVDSFIGRAEQAGASALVVTLDTTMLGWRPQDLDLGSLPFSQGVGIAQYTSDPRFQKLVQDRIDDAATGAVGRERPEVTLAALRTLVSLSRTHPGRVRDNLRSPVPRAAVETFLAVFSNPGLSWEHLRTLRRRTSLPLLLKGILHPDDARHAVEEGVDGIIVSNHGGRQVDRAISSLEALLAIRSSVGPAPTLLLDSGIRSGADLFLALALGADACLVGRPYIYGLALDGAQGVRDVLLNLLAELDLTMGLVGIESIAQITKESVLPLTVA